MLRTSFVINWRMPTRTTGSIIAAMVSALLTLTT